MAQLFPPLDGLPKPMFSSPEFVVLCTHQTDPPPLPSDALKHCIVMALTYHLETKPQ